MEQKKKRKRKRKNMTISLAFKPWQQASSFPHQRNGWCGLLVLTYFLMNTPKLNADVWGQMERKNIAELWKINYFWHKPSISWHLIQFYLNFDKLGIKWSIQMCSESPRKSFQEKIEAISLKRYIVEKSSRRQLVWINEKTIYPAALLVIIVVDPPKEEKSVFVFITFGFPPLLMLRILSFQLIRLRSGLKLKNSYCGRKCQKFLAMLIKSC